MQQFQLRALGNRTERVGGAGNHCLAHHIRTIRDQLQRQGSAGAGAQHVHRLTEVVMNGLGMPIGDLREGGVGGHSRPAVGEVDLETGPGQRGHGSQGEGSLQAGPRVSVVGRESAQIDQRLARTQREVR